MTNHDEHSGYCGTLIYKGMYFQYEEEEDRSVLAAFTVNRSKNFVFLKLFTVTTVILSYIITIRIGREVLSKQIVSHTYAMLNLKKDPPIILHWNPDLRSTNTLHQGKVTNRASTRTEKIPSTKSNDVLW